MRCRETDFGWNYCEDGTKREYCGEWEVSGRIYIWVNRFLELSERELVGYVLYEDGKGRFLLNGVLCWPREGGVKEIGRCCERWEVHLLLCSYELREKGVSKAVIIPEVTPHPLEMCVSLRVLNSHSSEYWVGLVSLGKSCISKDMSFLL